MLSLAKRVLAEYRTLLLKMGLEMATVAPAKANFELLGVYKLRCTLLRKCTLCIFVLKFSFFGSNY
jgi:hypothetical protein